MVEFTACRACGGAGEDYSTPASTSCVQCGGTGKVPTAGRPAESLLRQRHIEPVTVLELYETGLPSLMESNGLRFGWTSWLLCEVMGSSTNPIHHAMFTHFRFPKSFRKIGVAPVVEASRWNPTYEDDEHRDHVRIASLFYWRPVSVVLLKS